MRASNRWISCCLICLWMSACAAEDPYADVEWEEEIDRSVSHPKPTRVADANPDDCVRHFDPTLDYFPDKVVPQAAERFELEYFSHFKVARVRVQRQGESESVRYLLLLCGTPKPPGFDDAEVIEIPVRRVVTTSNSELPHLTTLGAVDRLVGHDNFTWVRSEEVRRRITDGEVAEIGGSGGIDLDAVLAVRPDVVLAASLGGAEMLAFDALAEQGLAVVHMPAFLETTPLGRAEWILLTAALLNREKLAQTTFQPILERYADLSHLARGEARRPRVLTGAPLGPTWYVTAGKSYLARLVTDAGGNYLWDEASDVGNLSLTLDDALRRAATAEVWLHPGAWRSRREIAAAGLRFTALSAFRESRIYSNDLRFEAPGENAFGSNDYWESGVARPDEVLADVIKILHPELLPEHELVYHRRFDDPVGEP